MAISVIFMLLFPVVGVVSFLIFLFLIFVGFVGTCTVLYTVIGWWGHRRQVRRGVSEAEQYAQPRSPK